MPEQSKWEHVPEVKILKEGLDNAEVQLEKLADKIRHHRTQIALHYKRVWRVSFTILGILLIIASITASAVTNNPVFVIGFVIGILVVVLGISGPADLSGLLIEPCTCSVCKPGKDLR